MPGHNIAMTIHDYRRGVDISKLYISKYLERDSSEYDSPALGSTTIFLTLSANLSTSQGIVPASKILRQDQSIEMTDLHGFNTAVQVTLTSKVYS
jgi:hypothetical protein